MINQWCSCGVEGCKTAGELIAPPPINAPCSRNSHTLSTSAATITTLYKEALRHSLSNNCLIIQVAQAIKHFQIIMTLTVHTIGHVVRSDVVKNSYYYSRVVSTLLHLALARYYRKQRLIDNNKSKVIIACSSSILQHHSALVTMLGSPLIYASMDTSPCSWPTRYTQSMMM